MDEMDKERQLIHELLDGELSPEKRRDLLELLHSSTLFSKEFDDLRRVIDILEAGERLTVSSAFTSQVMRRLPARKVSFRERVSGFLFGQRVLKWNVVTAVAAAGLMIIVAGGFFQFRNRNAVVSYQRSASGVTRTVPISFYAPGARRVSLAGDFNRWSAEKGLMKQENNGIWTLEVPLQPGTYHYMFVVDGEAWVTDPQAESYRDDGFGNRNSVLRVSL